MQTTRQKAAALLESSGRHQKAGHILDIFLICLIMINVIAIVLESVASLAQQYHTVFVAIEIGSVAIFTLEYIARLWSCVEKVEYKHCAQSNFKKRLKYACSPLALIDLLALSLIHI